MKIRHGLHANRATHKRAPKPQEGLAARPAEPFAYVDSQRVADELGTLEAEAKRAGRWARATRRVGRRLSARYVFAAGVVALAAFAISVQVERFQRTATAAIIVDSSASHLGEHPAIQAGRTVQYSFVVGGVEYGGVASVNWSAAAVRKAKVCYDPSDPANNGLVQDTGTCP